VTPLRILLVDDHEIVRRGLRSLIETQPQWQICAEAEDGREAVSLTLSLKPDIVVMDITMPLLNGLDATRQILAEAPNVRVLTLTMHDKEDVVREVLAAGAMGYVLKSDASRHLIEAIESLSRNEVYFTSRISRLVYSKVEAPPDQTGVDVELTLREREIVQLVAEGHNGVEIAKILGMAVPTVNKHRANIIQKMHFDSMGDLVRYAIRHNLIEA